jgi:hypothetical protein
MRMGRRTRQLAFVTVAVPHVKVTKWDGRSEVGTSNTQTGRLNPGEWTRVLSGWGYYTVDYGVTVTADCEFRCNIALVPFPWSTGELRPNGVNRITHRVVSYGDVWFLSNTDARYAIYPVYP